MICRPRYATPKERLEIALCCAKGGPDLETVKGHLEGAAVAAFDHYTTDSPGYQGTVYAVVWPGGPELVSSFIRHPDNYIIEASEPSHVDYVDPDPPQPYRSGGETWAGKDDDPDKLNVPQLKATLESTGIRVEVIDENTDFSKLPPLK